MSPIRFRQVAHLEELAQAYLKRKREHRAQMGEIIRKKAFVSVANLSLLILYGMPAINESLLNGWDRVRKSAAWRACRRDHPDFGEYGYEDQRDEDQEILSEYERDDKKDVRDRIYRGTKYFDKSSGMYMATPFDSLGAKYIANYFHKYFLPDLPGADQAEKLNRILKSAASWLLWFTFADVYGRTIGLTIPDLSSMSRFARGELPLGRLPEGPFKRHLLPPGTNDKFFRSAEEQPTIVLPDNLTRRERDRAIRIYKGLDMSAR